MQIPWITVAGWYHAVLLAALPWLAAWRPNWLPLAAGLAALVWPVIDRSRRHQLAPTTLVLVSAATFLAIVASLATAGGWLVLGGVTVVVGFTAPRPTRGRPSAADVAAVLCLALPFALRPELLATSGGGWLAPVVLILACRQLPRSIDSRRGPEAEIGPPTRRVRGTVSLRAVVVASSDRTPRSAPLDLELRAGGSLAILADSAIDRQLLGDVLAGRRRPLAGELAIDGAPVTTGDRLVAVVAAGETFLRGGVELNVVALCTDDPDGDTISAIFEACSLAEVEDALADRSIARDGWPLDAVHRLLLLAARIIPSEYHIVVVIDPGIWTNAIRAQAWRAAVVRASIGRTSVWITDDRDLAARADRLLEFRQGSLRGAVEP